MKYKSASELKAIARQRLWGRYGTTVGASALLFMILLAADYFSLSFLDYGNHFSIVLYIIVNFVIALLSGVLLSGAAYLFLNVIYEQPVRISDLFYGFRQNADKAIQLQLILVLIRMLCGIPLTVYVYTAGERYHFWLEMLLRLATLFLYLVPLMYFSQAFFLLQDFPGHSVASIVRTGGRLMRGSKLRLYLTLVSFLPLLLVCAFTLFVPLLWLLPYIGATLAAFYQDLMTAKNTASV